MLTATLSVPDTSHEVVEAFQAIGLPLHKKLESMLNEAPEHQRPRRGCGFTQAGRFLAEFVNQTRGLTPQLDLGLFSEKGQRKLSSMLAVSRTFLGRMPKGLSELRQSFTTCREFETKAEEYLRLLEQLKNLPKTLEYEESCLIVELILSILGENEKNPVASSLPPSKEKLAIGTCPEAERYFLEFAGGYVRRNGIVNILTNDNQEGLIVEKIGLGDSHSCITLVPVYLNQVLLPAGSLLGTQYSSSPIDAKHCKEFNGACLPISHCEGFRFLRLTTLAISPENRVRAFSQHVKKQLEGSPFFDPLNTKLSDLISVSQKQLS